MSALPFEQITDLQLESSSSGFPSQSLSRPSEHLAILQSSISFGAVKSVSQDVNSELVSSFFVIMKPFIDSAAFWHIPPISTHFSS